MAAWRARAADAARQACSSHRSAAGFSCLGEGGYAGSRSQTPRRHKAGSEPRQREPSYPRGGGSQRQPLNTAKAGASPAPPGPAGERPRAAGCSCAPGTAPGAPSRSATLASGMWRVTQPSPVWQSGHEGQQPCSSPERGPSSPLACAPAGRCPAAPGAAGSAGEGAGSGHPTEPGADGTARQTDTWLPVRGASRPQERPRHGGWPWCLCGAEHELGRAQQLCHPLAQAAPQGQTPPVLQQRITGSGEQWRSFFCSRSSEARQREPPPPPPVPAGGQGHAAMPGVRSAELSQGSSGSGATDEADTGVRSTARSCRNTAAVRRGAQRGTAFLATKSRLVNHVPLWLINI